MPECRELQNGKIHAWPLCRYCGARRGHGAVRRKDEASDRRVVEIIRKVARVAAGLADRCEIQVSYAIGVAFHTILLM